MVSLDFSVTYSFRPYHCPGVDPALSENEYQEYFLGVKTAGAWGWRPHHFHVPNVMEIWEPKPPGTLWATPGLLRDPFNFYINYRQLWCSIHELGLYLWGPCLNTLKTNFIKKCFIWRVYPIYAFLELCDFIKDFCTYGLWFKLA
jgi:hypothetical protein